MNEHLPLFRLPPIWPVLTFHVTPATNPDHYGEPYILVMWDNGRTARAVGFYDWAAALNYASEHEYLDLASTVRVRPVRIGDRYV